MNTVKCHAKDPSTCRFHRPDAGTIAKAALDQARARFAEADSKEEVDSADSYIEARWAVSQAEETYYATEMGVAELTAEMEKETNEGNLFEMEMKLSRAKYALADAERQNQIDERNGGPLIPPVHTYNLNTGMTADAEAASNGWEDPLWPKFTGNKYERGLSALDIKKKVNADIKEAQKAGYLPKHIKFGVRSHGNTLTVNIIGVADEQIYNYPEEKQRHDLTKQARELRERVQGIVSAYQDSRYDHVEGRTNYTNFYDRVDFESGWEKELRLEREEAAAARKAAKTTTASSSSASADLGGLLGKEKGLNIIYRNKMLKALNTGDAEMVGVRKVYDEIVGRETKEGVRLMDPAFKQSFIASFNKNVTKENQIRN